MLFTILQEHDSELKQLSEGCARQVKRVMKQRARSIDLEPEIEEECLTDLGIYCSDLESYGKGEVCRFLRR